VLSIQNTVLIALNTVIVFSYLLNYLKDIYSHLTHVNMPCFNTSQADQYLIYLP